MSGLSSEFRSVTQSVRQMSADGSKRMVIIAMVVAGAVALMALSDLIIGVPFGTHEKTLLMDILFIVSSALVLYLGWDAYKDLR